MWCFINEDKIKQGIVYKGMGGVYYVKVGERRLPAIARGKIKQTMKLKIGDRVRVSLDDGTAVIESILPRINELTRPAVANVTQALIVVSVQEPEPNWYVVDKMIIQAEVAGMTPILCINKIDLAAYDEGRYAQSGLLILKTGAMGGQGINELYHILKDQVTVFTGFSGVGKSTLLNQLSNHFSVKTGKISTALKRGKHTTRHSEVFELTHGGIVVDSPGFSSISLDVLDLTAEELADYFNEFEPYRGQCRFGNCVHRNEPGCAVVQAVTRGEIHLERYESYERMYEELTEYGK